MLPGEDSADLFKEISPILTTVMMDSTAVGPRGRQGCAEALGIGAFIVVKDITVSKAYFHTCTAVISATHCYNLPSFSKMRMYGYILENRRDHAEPRENLPRFVLER